jgi:rhamnosyltransferase
MSEPLPIEWSPKIAGAAILYHPDYDVVSNIHSYIDEIAVLFVIDNSEIANREIVEQIQRFDKVEYLFNGENLGIAKALNIAAEKALENGYDYLLTMDQDSCASPGMVTCMLDCLKECDASTIGIIGPFHVNDFDDQTAGAEKCEDVVSTMTSGNLLNLKLYSSVGPFLDDLFIDQVDNEYCMRLIRHGYRIVQANKALLRHSLGNISRIAFMGRQLRTSNHSALRRYYMTRNRFFVWQKYGDLDAAQNTIAKDKVCFRGEIRNILLMERDKLAKITMILKGYIDYKRNIFGKYRD